MFHAGRAILVCFALASFAAGCARPAEAPAPSAANTQEDADFGLRLGLLEGHLQVGRQLIEAGQPDNALPHFGHPIRELYGDIRPVVAARGGVQFEGDLVRLEFLAALQGASNEFDAAFDATLGKVAAARALIQPSTLQSDAYVLRLVSDTASVAAQEYRNAVVGGRIGSLIEYHDARGFIFYANALLSAHQGSDPKLAEAVALIGQLKTFVEPLDPPNPAIATDAQFEEKAAALRALVGAPASTVTDAPPTAP